ncbi:MAG: MBL fold metallo-hydrolase [Erythrobacter sp.]
MKRLVLAGFGFLVIAVIVVIAVAQRPIGEFLFARAVEQRVGVDRTAELPDGLHVYVCGSGSPMGDPERAGPCLAVLAGDTALVFDVGSGSVRNLGAMGFPFPRLDAAFLTHLHSDHLDSLGELMLQAWIAGGSDTPLPIHGPPGTERVVAGFVEAYTIDRGYRIAHHGTAVANPRGFGAEAQVIDVDQLEAAGGNGTVWSNGDVRVSVMAVDHSPADPAFAYRVEYGGRSVVISGDTSTVPGMAQFAEGADVIFHDALNPEMVGQMQAALERRGQPNLAKIMADIPDYHASPLEAAKTAERAGVSTLVLYHLVPGPPIALMEDAFIGDARDAFGGTLRLAEDGMIVSLPAGDTAVTFDQLF